MYHLVKKSYSEPFTAINYYFLLLFDLSSTEQEDIFLFTSFRIVKSSGPATIMEGGEAQYSIRLNGPPPSLVGVNATDLDGLTR